MDKQRKITLNFFYTQITSYSRTASNGLVHLCVAVYCKGGGGRKQVAGNGAVFVHSRYAYQTKLAGRNHPVLRLYESHFSFHCYDAALPRLLVLTPFLPLLSDYEKCVPPSLGIKLSGRKARKEVRPCGAGPMAVACAGREAIRL